MQKLIVKFNQKIAKPDITEFTYYHYRFYSETTLVYFDENGIFHCPVKIQFLRHKTRVFCVLWVQYGEYDIQSGGSCFIGQYSSSTRRVIQEAIDLAEMEISPSFLDGSFLDLGFDLEEKVAIAIAHALGLDPKRWTLISSGGSQHNF